MNPMAMVSRFVSVATLGLIGAFTAAAGPIPISILVANPSFEIPPPGGLPNGCPSGCYSVGAIPGWSGSNSTSGEFRPVSIGFTSLSNGPTVAFSDGAPRISQTVSGTVALGITYTLMVDVGARNDLGFGAAADLLIGSISGGHRIPATGGTPAKGGWATWTANYIGLGTDVGQPITIELTFTRRQADFDNVRLSSLAPAVSAVPEPADITLLGLGLAGLCVAARRKRAS